MSFKVKPKHAVGAAVALAIASRVGVFDNPENGETLPVASPARPATDLIYEYQSGDGPLDAAYGCTGSQDDADAVWGKMEPRIRYVDDQLKPQPGDTYDFSPIQSELGAMVIINCTQVSFTG